MDFEPTERQRYWRDRVRQFIENHVRPRNDDYKAEDKSGERWKVLQVVEEEKARAKAQGIWNLFMPPRNSGHHHVEESFEFEGPGLTNLEYAMCAEEMGRIGWSSEVFNCSAPDTGNMEVLHRYGTLEQKEKWLKPLMNGEIRSAFLMTEPLVASSDATNIETSIRREGDEYVINGRKWWSSGLGDPRCKIAIVMGKTDFEAKRHQQQLPQLKAQTPPGQHALGLVGRVGECIGHGSAPQPETSGQGQQATQNGTEHQCQCLTARSRKPGHQHLHAEGGEGAEAPQETDTQQQTQLRPRFAAALQGRDQAKGETGRQVHAEGGPVLAGHHRLDVIHQAEAQPGAGHSADDHQQNIAHGQASRRTRSGSQPAAARGGQTGG